MITVVEVDQRLTETRSLKKSTRTAVRCNLRGVFTDDQQVRHFFPFYSVVLGVRGYVLLFLLLNFAIKFERKIEDYVCKRSTIYYDRVQSKMCDYLNNRDIGIAPGNVMGNN